MIVLHKFYLVRSKKSFLYKLALQKSQQTKKPLMVIGDPKNGNFFNRFIVHPLIGEPYGYGDICFDLNGCPENKGNNIKGKLEDILSKKFFKTNSFVIYISQTLEYVPTHDLDGVIKELTRISGKDLFVVNMDFKNDSYQDRNQTFVRNNIILKCPPEYNYFEYKTLGESKLYHINM